MFRHYRTAYWGFIGLAVAVAACWLFNVAYYRESQLEKPIFLDHYIEAESGSGAIFYLYVLENRGAGNRVERIRIPGLEEARVSLSWRDTYRYQELARFEVFLDQEAASEIYFENWENAEEPIVIEQVEAMYTDGSVLNENIGEIRLYPRLYSTDKPLSAQYAAMQSQSGQSTVMAQEDLKIAGVDYDDASRLGNRLELYWGQGSEVGEWDFERPEDERIIGKPINEVEFPIGLKLGEDATVRYRFQDATAHDWTKVYRLLPRFQVETKQETVEARPMVVQYDPYPSEDEVRQFVEERRDHP
ncbi:hypothetical protein [Saccharibacillus sacchari]|uniref:hypothetical protein n=1 Tax=Saccharibacillus sacchari TaxID=456493 RepID=UPI0004B1EE7A|nr:hypothetical protein [Saccharibacillus sacchari]